MQMASFRFKKVLQKALVSTFLGNLRTSYFVSMSVFASLKGGIVIAQYRNISQRTCFVLLFKKQFNSIF